MSIAVAAHRRFTLLAALVMFSVVLGVQRAGADGPTQWKDEWPRTDFSKVTIPLSEIRSVIGRDRIPAIDRPKFVSVRDISAATLSDNEPVISFVIGDDARAYPLRILTWHEIVNDVVNGMPVAVTYCPLCNSALVFDRRLDGRVLSFGTTGKLRNSDLVMYDRETEGWWQQYTGEALVGAASGRKLAMLPMRMESIGRFRQRFPDGKVLVPNEPDSRDYGRNPYLRYDSSARPFLFDGPLPEGVPPLERVVVVDGVAWTFSLLRKRKQVVVGDLVITWEPGQSSALDAALVKDGRDVGNVVVQRRGKDGALTDAIHDVSFAFAFRAFFPKGLIHHE